MFGHGSRLPETRNAFGSLEYSILMASQAEGMWQSFRDTKELLCWEARRR